MALTKNPIIRYRVLDNCFQNFRKRYYWKDLLDACNEAIYAAGGEGIKKRQLYDDILFMQSEAGGGAPIEAYRDEGDLRKNYYRYSDANYSYWEKPITDQERKDLIGAMTTLSSFSGAPNFEWTDEVIARLEGELSITNKGKVVFFEQNEFLSNVGSNFKPLYDAIINEVVLKINHIQFGVAEVIQSEFHPYFLKQFNNRWYVFGYEIKEDSIIRIGLDRIENLAEMSNVKYKNDITDFNEYFDDVIGVTVSAEKKVERITIRVDKKDWPYVESKPLHGSQRKPFNITDECLDFTIDVIPNYEFEALILSYGETMEVISPEHIREKLKKRLEELVNKYTK